MDRFPHCSLAISIDKKSPKHWVFGTLSKLEASISALGRGVVYRVALSSHDYILTTENSFVQRNGNDWLVSPNKVFLNSASHESISPKEMLERFRKSDSRHAMVADFAAPFVTILGIGGSVEAYPDPMGIGHLYSYSNETLSVLSTNASILAKAFELEIDKYGLLQQFMVGHRLGQATLFKSVDLVSAGHFAKICDGSLSCAPYPRSRAAMNHGDLIESGSLTIKKAVELCLEAVPDAGIELSGGLDSRLALSAIPKQRRSGMTAFTIGFEGGVDVRIAEDIARQNNMHHQFVNLGSLATDTAHNLLNRARRVAFRDDFSSNVLDRITIDLVDDTLLLEERIGGVNGEAARGFYYPGMNLESAPSSDDAARLIKWRLTTNDALPRSALNGDELAQFDDRLRSDVTELLTEGTRTLGQSLDRLYVGQRMRHWAGKPISGAMCNRTVLTPFFHQEYVDWAFSLDFHLKTDSIALCQVMHTLDQDLASIALDSGIVPSSVAVHGRLDKYGAAKLKLGKAWTKLSQRFLGRRKANLGTEQIAHRLPEGEITETVDWTRIQNIGLFRELDQDERTKLITGGRSTLGHILALHHLLEFLHSDPIPPKVEALND